MDFGRRPWRGDKTFGGVADRDWAQPDFWVDFAHSLERACFDFMLFAESTYIGDLHEGSMRVALKYGIGGPKHDLTALLPILAHETKRLGLIATMTTTEWYPYQLARYMLTLDHLSKGRAGWNIVTGGADRAAQNYGRQAAEPHDVRYDMSDEFVDIVTQLWASWEPDAVQLDYDNNIYADHTKVHTIDYEGEYFSCRGPGQGLPSPQGRPVLLQAGGSPRGRAFAARWSDVIIATAQSPAAVAKYRAEVTEGLIKAGRKADDCKVLFMVTPIVKSTDAEAKAEADLQLAWEHANIDKMLAAIGKNLSLDLSGLDIDKPVPDDLTSNDHTSMLDQMKASGKPLRDAVLSFLDPGPFVGSPDTVADRIGQAVADSGADGILIVQGSETRRYISEITDGLVPALQRRGLVRSEYSGTHLRDHLFEF